MRKTAALLCAVTIVSASSCARVDRRPAVPPDTTIDGLEIVYRFPIGRTYRAAYGPDTVAFELIEPRLAVAPGATLPYQSEEIRTGLHLVVWDHPEYGATFVIDLADRKLYVRSRRGGGGLFAGTAEVLEVRRAPRPEPVP